MDCYDGCGAPLVDGVCEHCGRTYPTEPLITFNVSGIIEDALESEEEEEIVAVIEPDNPDEGRPEPMSFGPGYEPGLMEYGIGGTFEDAQATLGMATVAFIIIGALFGFFAPAIALPFLGIGLLAGLTGGIRQWRHKEEE